MSEVKLPYCPYPEWHVWEGADFLIRAIGIPERIGVSIDIKPGSYPNCFNNNGNGVIPVAVLGDCSSFVNDIDPATVQLAGLSVRARGRNSEKYLAHIEDVNGDGCDDLVFQIEDSDGIFAPGTGTAILKGYLNDGTHFVGTDEICVVP